MVETQMLPHITKSISRNVRKVSGTVPEYKRTDDGDPTGNRTRATTVKGWCPNR